MNGSCDLWRKTPKKLDKFQEYKINCLNLSLHNLCVLWIIFFIEINHLVINLSCISWLFQIRSTKKIITLRQNVSLEIRKYKMHKARLALYLVGRHGNYFFDIFRDILVKHKTNYQKYRKMKHFRYLIPIYLWFLCIFWVLNCIQYFCSKAYVVNRCRSMPRTLIKQKTHIFSVLKW